MFTSNAASLVAHLDSRVAAVERKAAPHGESSDLAASAELDLSGLCACTSGTTNMWLMNAMGHVTHHEYQLL